MPFATADVFNEKRLYLHLNMCDADSKFTNTGTNPGKPGTLFLSLPDLVGMNCETVKEALIYIRNSTPTTGTSSEEKVP